MTSSGFANLYILVSRGRFLKRQIIWILIVLAVGALVRLLLPAAPLHPTNQAVLQSGDFVNPKDGSILTLIPEGTLMEGGSHPIYAFDRQGRSQPIAVPAFYMSRCEVTNAQFRRFLNARNTTPSQSIQRSLSNDPLDPVIGVSYGEALAYCDWAGVRLPTDIEWERAARGGDERLFPWGSEDPWSTSRVARGRGPELVGTHPTGQSPFGCYDMSGNAAEWTSSDFRSTDFKIVRGGSYASDHPQSFTVVHRASSQNVDPSLIGFRTAMDRK